MIIVKQTKNNRQGLSLIEILISLLILSGSLAFIFSGFDISSKLTNHATFESEAAFLAEREIELTKSELLNGNIKILKARQFPCRFRLKPGWKLITIMTQPDIYDTVRLQVRVSHSDRELQLESFLYLPQGASKNG